MMKRLYKWKTSDIDGVLVNIYLDLETAVIAFPDMREIILYKGETVFQSWKRVSLHLDHFMDILSCGEIEIRIYEIWTMLQ